jgi:hypothetical protein
MHWRNRKLLTFLILGAFFASESGAQSKAMAKPKDFAARHWSLSAFGGYHFFLDRSEPGLFPSSPLVSAELIMHNAITQHVGMKLFGSYGWNNTQTSFSIFQNLAVQFSMASLSLGAFYEFQPTTRFVPLLGIHVSFVSMTRVFDDLTFAAQNFNSLSPGVFAGIKMRISGGFSIALNVRASLIFYNIDDSRTLGATDINLGINYEFF